MATTRKKTVRKKSKKVESPKPTQEKKQVIEDGVLDLKKRPAFDPEKASFEKLDPLARRVFQIETANAGIKVSEIIDILREGNLQFADDTIYRIRKRPEYQALLYEHQKTELDLWTEMQLLAARRMKQSLSSPSEKVRHDAAKFMMTHQREIQMKKAEFEFELEMKEREIKDPSRHTHVRVVFDDSIPLLGESTMTEDGKVIPVSKLHGGEETKKPEASSGSIPDGHRQGPEPSRSGAPAEPEKSKDEGQPDTSQGDTVIVDGTPWEGV